MNLLTAEGLSKSYTEKLLFENISFGIHEGDKIGVIGVNGTGKSTLLKILAGAEEPDAGAIAKMNNLRIAYLSQNPIFEKDATILSQVFQGDNPTLHLVQEYEEAALMAEEMPENQEVIQKLTLLGEKMDKAGAWSLESEAKSILTKLGVGDYHKKMEALSGGQRKRAAMAAALISPVDLLILDEPTNHIDSETVAWLEKYLEKYNKALLMVTHDRYFLDRVTNKILELSHGKLYGYDGNYSSFLEQKAEREELEQAGERKRQNLLRRELAWIRRGAKARSTKQKARIERFEELSDIKPPEADGNVEINVGASRLGKKTIEINHVSKAYDGQTYIQDFNYIILRNDRIGIVGPNGCGKSTLLKIITGEIKPDKGFVEWGDTVKIGMFSQDSKEMPLDIRVIDYLKEEGEYVPTADGRITAAQMLEKFLFLPDLQYSPINRLSGGEKRRLYLLKVLMQAPNILFLDEPTNDLDIETLSILEEYLEEFPGAVITVSHDRYFLDRTVQRIFAFCSDGTLKQYEGGYTDYSLACSEEAVSKDEKPAKEKKETLEGKEEGKGRPITKLSYKDQREFEAIGGIIEELEANVESLEQKISEAGSDYVLLEQLTKEKEECSEKLEETMERWLYLSELAEEIEKNKEKQQRN